jgi:hypothetical protein
MLLGFVSENDARLHAEAEVMGCHERRLVGSVVPGIEISTHDGEP